MNGGDSFKSASRTPTWEVELNCEHMGCRCQVGPGEQFCGDYCREHAGDAMHEEHVCECGHAACTTAVS